MKILRFFLFFLIVGCNRNSSVDSVESQIEPTSLDVQPELYFGIPRDSFEIVKGIVRPRQNLSELLTNFKVDHQTIHRLAIQSAGVFDLRKIKVGRPYSIFMSLDSLKDAHFAVYEPDEMNYVVFSLQDSLMVSTHRHESRKEIKILSATIESSVYNAVKDLGAPYELINQLVDIYAWQIDFFRIQNGDRFTLIYEDVIVGDKSVAVGKIKAASFNHSQKSFYAFYFDNDTARGYYDEHAKNLRKEFLKAPLNYSRVSSGFSYKRFHPILKRYKPHLGIDYAAPTGTPIRTIGDGVVEKSGYTRGNGNYVKIKHNPNYSTQYLHMSKIAKGMVKGIKVTQGQTIGYVGSTGLATGPHLCFRFWKNGKQVNPLSIKIPPSDPLDSVFIDQFIRQRDQFKELLKSGGINGTSEIKPIVDVI